MDIQELKRKGYCVVSRRHGMLSRIDRADWKEVMAREHAPWDLEEGRLWVRLLENQGHAEDHYRRCYSKDVIEPKIDRNVLLNEFPNSNHTRTGFVE